MLAADRELLFAKLRMEAATIRTTELHTIVGRFGLLAGTSSLLGGFAFAGIVEFEFADVERAEKTTSVFIANPEVAETVFYISAAVTLILSLYVLAVSGLASYAGYRLAVQSGLVSAAEHSEDVQRLQIVLLSATFASAGAYIGIIVAAMAVVACKAPSETVPIVFSCFALIVIPLVWVMVKLRGIKMGKGSTEVGGRRGTLMTVGKGASTREIDVTDLAALQSTHDDFPDDVEPGYVPPQPKEAAPLAANGAKTAADERSALLSRGDQKPLVRARDFLPGGRSSSR